MSEFTIEGFPFPLPSLGHAFPIQVHSELSCGFPPLKYGFQSPVGHTELFFWLTRFLARLPLPRCTRHQVQLGNRTPVSQPPGSDEQQLGVNLGAHWLSIPVTIQLQRRGVIYIVQSASFSPGVGISTVCLSSNLVLASIRC